VSCMGKKYSIAVMGIVIGILTVWSGLPSVFCEWQNPHPDILLPASSHEWAASIQKPGLPNLHHVSDDLYRGAQPTAEGFRQLQAMGVKTVINLRFFHSDRELITGTDLDYEEIPMNTWHAEDEDVVRFLTLVSDKSRAPFFVHCQHGADRTGMMCAVYRIVIQGWTRDEAIKEMTSERFGFHEIWSNLVAYLQEFDLEKLKQQAF
jgi:protein tyrosine/serine phosphatase